MITANYVVIGGGVVGSAVAYYLAKFGAKDVILLEKEKFLATGSTAKSAGGVRKQFTTPINISLSKRSFEIFENFENEFRQDPCLVQNGYLLAASTDATWNTVRKNVAIQRENGIDVSLITPDDALKIVPQLNIADVLGAAFCPTDGYIDPNSLTQGFASSARRLGVKIMLEEEVKKIVVAKGKISAVETASEKISAPTVINATGPWLAVVARLAGAEIPVEPVRRMLFTTKTFDKITPKLPMVVDLATGLYCRKEAGNTIMMGMANKDEPSGFNFDVDWAWLEKMVECATHRIPVLAEAEIDTGWAGLYEVTPDHHPIIDAVPEVGGFYVVGGFSGHGIMHSAAAGEAMAQLALTGKPKIDISPLRITRFAEGALVHETAVF